VRIALSFLATPLALTLAALTGCSAPPSDARFPTRAEGCNVTVFPESPSMPTDNIGPVTATCGLDVSNDDCLRTLKDQTCKLGGDIVWGVADVPTESQGKKKLGGRAAHTKTGK
jgi:hypothetical protein